MGYYMELMKGLKEADKEHVLDTQPTLVGVVEPAELTVTSYLQIGIGYNYFCEEPLCGQPNDTACSTAHNIILCVIQQSSTSDHVPMYMLKPGTVLQKLLQFDMRRVQHMRQMI